MSIPEILFIIALVLGCIEEFRTQGRSFLGWAVILICIGLLWGALRG